MVHTKRRCTKYKLFLTSSDTLTNIEKAVFKLTQNLTSKLQFNGFLFSGRMLSSCLWWLSHHCLCLVLRTFYLIRLMFLVYSSQGLHVPFFYTYLKLRRLFSGKLNCPWHSLVCLVALNDSQLPFMLSCWCSMQRVNTFFFDSPIYLSLHGYRQYIWFRFAKISVIYAPGWLSRMTITLQDDY